MYLTKREELKKIIEGIVGKVPDKETMFLYVSHHYHIEEEVTCSYAAYIDHLRSKLPKSVHAVYGSPIIVAWIYLYCMDKCPDKLKELQRLPDKIESKGNYLKHPYTKSKEFYIPVLASAARSVSQYLYNLGYTDRKSMNAKVKELADMVSEEDCKTNYLQVDVEKAWWAIFQLQLI